MARDHEYKRHCTLSLLVGIDLLNGKVYGLGYPIGFGNPVGVNLTGYWRDLLTRCRPRPVRPRSGTIKQVPLIRFMVLLVMAQSPDVGSDVCHIGL